MPKTPASVENPPVISEADYMDLTDTPGVTPASGSESKEPVVEPAPVTDPVNPAEPVDPKNDPKRFEYWQSRADKFESRIKELEPLVPLDNLLRQNPELVKTIDSVVTGKVPAPKEPEIVKPVMPAKPANYDPVEAIQSPESDSFKYRSAVEKYSIDMAEYVDKRETVRQREFMKTQEMIMAREREQQQKLAVKAELQARGIVGAEADEFIAKWSDPASINMDNLIELHKISKSKPKPAADTKAELLARRAANSQIPLPPGISAGGVSEIPTTQTEEDVFNDSLYEVARSTRYKR